MNIQNNGYLSIEQLTDQYLNRAKGTESPSNSEQLSFREILQQKSLESRVENADSAGSLKFSKHALERLNDRNIELNTQTSIFQVDFLPPYSTAMLAAAEEPQYSGA